MAPLDYLIINFIVKWVTPNNDERTGNKKIKGKVSRLPQSSCVAFGRWCSSQNWFADVKETTSASMLANSFNEELNFAIDRIFAVQAVKIHHTLTNHG